MENKTKYSKDQVLRSALKFKYKTEWQNCEKKSYYASIKNGWYKEVTAHMMPKPKKISKYDFNTCQEIAKRYKSKSDFQEYMSGAYKIAKKNNWLVIFYPERYLPEAPVWTYAKCKEIAAQFDSISKLRRKYNAAAKMMSNRGWLDEFYPNREKHKLPADYSLITYDYCKEICRQYTHVSDLRKGNLPVYNVCAKNGWFEEFFDYYQKFYRRGYDDCKEITSKYTNSTLFRKSEPKIYDAILRNKWYDLLEHMEGDRNPPGYWTYERCKDTARKYRTKKALTKDHAACSHVIYQNGWYELFDHMKILPTAAFRYIYVFEFEDMHAYIGLTYNPEKRRRDHFSDKSSSVAKHYAKGVRYKFKVLTEKMVAKQASKVERDFIEKYNQSGWVILNVNRGGCLGFKPGYSYENCKNKVAEYTMLSTFTKEASGYYSRIKKMGWDELLKPLMKTCDYMKSFQYYLDTYPEVIEELRKGPVSNKYIAKKYGISLSTVWKIKTKLKNH